MDPDPPYEAIPGKIPAEVRATDHRDSAEEAGGGGGILLWRINSLSLIVSVKPITVMKFTFFIRARGSIEPHFFAYLFITFHR